MPGKHAILPASGAERWIRCTPSARLEQQFEDSGSDYAAEGTLAHAIAELKIRKQFIEPMGARSFNSRMKKLKEDSLYQEEMQGYTDQFLEYITGIAMQYERTPYVIAEKRVRFDRFVPEGFGTSDCIIIGASTMHVVDFKYGKGVPVSADHNPQMMLYALGAIEEYMLLYRIDTVVMTIVQPRLDNISEFTIKRDDLIHWGVDEVRPKAEAAFKGEGDFIPGDHCRFCRAKAQCRARAGTQTALEAFGGKLPPLLNDTEVGDILKRAQTLKSWVSDLEEYALSAILLGKTIPGWKAVEGRKTRAFDDMDAAFAAITGAGYDEALLYERKPLTLASVEKVLGKGKFAEIVGSHIITPPGKPTLAPESDKREPITNKQTAAEAFGAKTEE